MWNINDMITNTRIHFNKRYNIPKIIIKLNISASELFKKVTADNLKKRLAIILDNQILSAPVIQEQITTGKFWINGDNIEEVKNIALILMAGAYPMPSTLLAEYSE